MSKLTEKLAHDWQDTANCVLGALLIISPWALGYAANDIVTGNVVVVGLIVALTAAGALYAFHAWEEWINVALGAWLIVSPWLLGYGTQQTPVLNQVVLGTLIGMLAVWSAAIEHPGERGSQG